MTLCSVVSLLSVGRGSDIVIAIDQRGKEERIERRCRRRSFAVSFRCQNHYKFRKERNGDDGRLDSTLLSIAAFLTIYTDRPYPFN